MKYQKGITSILAVGILAIVLIAGGAAYYAVTQPDEVSNDEESMMEKDEESMMEKEDEIMMEEDKMMEETSMSTGSYEAYSPEKLSKAEDGKVVLFFRASWCPTCRALDSNIKSNLGDIPEGLTILDVDYDNSTALKQKYGVTYQHTLVQVDAEGNMIKKWTNSQTLQALASQVV